MKKVLVVIFAASLIALAAFQIPVQNGTSLEEALTKNFEDQPMTEIRKPDLRVLDFDLVSE